jgi:hypothetical protein
VADIIGARLVWTAAMISSVSMPPDNSRHASVDPVLVVLRRYPVTVKHSVLSTIPTAETPALSDEERTERLRRLAERMFSSDGLDRDTLEHIEQLTADES